MKSAVFALGLTLLSAPVAAHPHVFIDATLELEVDQAFQLHEVRAIWVYDELYTMLLLGDLGLDPDGDGVLLPDEQAKLLAAESTWDPMYEGDTYAFIGEEKVALGPPHDFEVVLKDGRITSSHRRALVTPVDLATEKMRWKAYDPWYYAAFTLSGGAQIKGAEGCQVAYLRPDLNAAYAKLDDMLYGPGSTELAEGEYPQVGAEFADEAQVTCATP